MATITSPLSPPPEPIMRLTVEQYHAMIANGILTDDDRVELLDGMLVEKMTKNPPHTFATQTVEEFLKSMALSGWTVRSQDPITLADSEPEPDVALVRGSKKDFAARHPHASEVGLVVEVADASLARDRGFKLQLYAKAKLPVYWIVNLIDRQIEVYTNPEIGDLGPTYATRRDFRDGQEIAVEISGREIGRVIVCDCFP